MDPPELRESYVIFTPSPAELNSMMAETGHKGAWRGVARGRFNGAVIAGVPPLPPPPPAERAAGVCAARRGANRTEIISFIRRSK